MLDTRCHRADYDHWAALGCTGWSWDECLPWFRKAENNANGADAHHGADGRCMCLTREKSPRPDQPGLRGRQPLNAATPKRLDFNRGRA